MHKIFRHAAADLPASIVVFLVALPLCLGIAVASDATPIAGIIAGICGGILIGMLSGSALSVSGPAAGLTAIVAGAIGRLPSYDIFLLSVVLAGGMQLLLGFLKAGFIGDFIPNAVIKGMLAAIGMILMLKQIPHFLGYSTIPVGDESFSQREQGNTFSTLVLAFRNPQPGAVMIALASAALLLLYELKAIRRRRIFQLIPGPLVVVVMAVCMNQWFLARLPHLGLSGSHLVALEINSRPLDFFTTLSHPDFGALGNPQVWVTAFTIAIIASLETLLSIEAVDKIDPLKRITPANRELKAQGIGNMVSGLLGGLPVTSVIVRSSANVSAGGVTKLSAIAHGFWLLLSLLFIPHLLNLIPLSALAAILILTGYKLAHIQLFTSHYRKGWNQFLPFLVTTIAILVTDLLIGICVGIVTGLYFIRRTHFKPAIIVKKFDNRYLFRFRRKVTFLNKALLKTALAAVPDHAEVVIDASRSEFVDSDITEMVNDFIVNAAFRHIKVYIKQKKDGGATYFKDASRKAYSE